MDDVIITLKFKGGLKINTSLKDVEIIDNCEFLPSYLLRFKSTNLEARISKELYDIINKSLNFEHSSKRSIKFSTDNVIVSVTKKISRIENEINGYLFDEDGICEDATISILHSFDEYQGRIGICKDFKSDEECDYWQVAYEFWQFEKEGDDSVFAISEDQGLTWKEV